MEDILVRATRGQIEDFVESMIWKDIKDELERLSVAAQSEYDLVGESTVDNQGVRMLPTSSETLIHLGDIKGRRKAVKYFLSIPEIFLSILEDRTAERESAKE